MKLYLVRHGNCVSSEIDPGQPLSQNGIRETEAIADFLKHSIVVDEIQHSGKKRAQQTAEIFGRALLSPHSNVVQREGLKPMDPIEVIMGEIRASHRNLMLVGHLPFMERLLSTLVIGEERISPVRFSGSTTVCLEQEGRLWQIAWVVSPNLVCNA